MTGYLAAVFLATVFMLMIHVAEWRTALAMATLLRFGSKPVAEARRLRRAIRGEAFYYLLVLPYLYFTANTMLRKKPGWPGVLRKRMFAQTLCRPLRQNSQ